MPDVLITAKAFGGGMPLGAFISSKEIMQTLTSNPAFGHITTFGGHPVCCAASLAALKETVQSGVINTVEEKALQFEKLLIHPKIKTIRHYGLLMSLEFENEKFVSKLVRTLIDNSVMADSFLFAYPCLRIAPPLIISNDEIQYACEIIHKTIDEISSA